MGVQKFSGYLDQGDGPLSINGMTQSDWVKVEEAKGRI